MTAFQSVPYDETTLSLADLNFSTALKLPSALTLTPILSSSDAISSVSLAPDGAHLAYATTKEGALWAAEIDGTNQIKLVESGIAAAAGIQWNTANTGVTALQQDNRQVDVMSLAESSTALGSLTASPSPELLGEPASTADMRNYSVPYIHQLWDTSDWFNGRCACGPTSATMALAAYGKLQPHPITISVPYSHQNSYGFYVAEKFDPFQNTLYNASPCPTGYGMYGQTVKNGAGGREYIDAATTRFGVNGTWAQYQSTFDIVKLALDRGHLVILSTDLTGAGHIILVKGYTNNGQIIVNDPYGNKFAGNYGKNIMVETCITHGIMCLRNGISNLREVSQAIRIQ